MTIFVDMDEVIADTYQGHIDLYNQEFNTNFTKEDCDGKDFWQVVPEEHIDSVRGHARREGYYANLDVVAHSQDVLEKLSKRHEVFIASAAMQFPNSLIEKSDWLDKHFPFIPWQNRILCGEKYILNGDVLIDDRSYHLRKFPKRGILFTSPHNRQTNGIERADSWLDIADKFL